MLFFIALIIGLVPFVLVSGGPPGGIPGGVNSVDTNDATVQQMATFAVGELCNDFSLVSVEEAGQQVVAGINHILKIIVNKASTDGTKPFTCDVTVLEQPWMNRKELKEFSCTSNSMF